MNVGVVAYGKVGIYPLSAYIGYMVWVPITKATYI